MNRGRLPNEYIRRPIQIHRPRVELGGHQHHAPRPNTSHTELSRGVSGAIGFYHIICGLFILLGLVKKWRVLGDEMSRNQTLTYEDREKELIRPFAYQIGSQFMFTGLGVILFLAICKESRHCLEAWLSCAATMNFFAIIRQTDYQMYGIVWDVLKSICELCVVWSYTMDLRKDEERLDAVNRTRRLLNIPVPVVPEQVNNNAIEGELNEILDPNTNRAIP